MADLKLESEGKTIGFPQTPFLGTKGQTRKARLTFSELTPHSFASLIRTLFIGFDLSDARNLDVTSNHSKIFPVGKKMAIGNKNFFLAFNLGFY